VGLGVGDEVGAAVGTGVGSAVGDSVGDSVGEAVGADVGLGVGDEVGAAVGSDVGSAVGDSVGESVGADVGLSVGDEVGGAVGSGVGSAVGDSVGESVGADVIVCFSKHRNVSPSLGTVVVMSIAPLPALSQSPSCTVHRTWHPMPSCILGFMAMHEGCARQAASVASRVSKAFEDPLPYFEPVQPHGVCFPFASRHGPVPTDLNSIA